MCRYVTLLVHWVTLHFFPLFCADKSAQVGLTLCQRGWVLHFSGRQTLWCAGVGKESDCVAEAWEPGVSAGPALQFLCFVYYSTRSVD